MSKNLGRNDPCWCGSGKKYKKCHIKPQENMESPINFLVNLNNQVLDKSYCLHPNTSECSGSIVKAHSVQKSGGLKELSERSHVYSFFDTRIRQAIKNTSPAIHEVGINNASTFTGFCSKHDSEIFRKIEFDNFTVDQEAAFLYCYRAICRELFWKRKQKDFQEGLFSATKKMILSYSQAIKEESLKDFYLGITLGLSEIEALKTQLDSYLTNKEFSRTYYYVAVIDSIPEIMCCAGTQPGFDFDGNQIQDLGNLTIPLEYITLTINYRNQRGNIIFSWTENSPKIESFIKSLHRQNDFQFTQSIFRFVFEFFENSYFSPKWWDSLSAESKYKILTRFHDSINVEKLRSSRCLRDDGTVYSDWNIIERLTNLSL